MILHLFHYHYAQLKSQKIPSLLLSHTHSDHGNETILFLCHGHNSSTLDGILMVWPLFQTNHSIVLN